MVSHIKQFRVNIGYRSLIKNKREGCKEGSSQGMFHEVGIAMDFQEK